MNRQEMDYCFQSVVSNCSSGQRARNRVFPLPLILNLLCHLDSFHSILLCPCMMLHSSFSQEVPWPCQRVLQISLSLPSLDWTKQDIFLLYMQKNSLIIIYIKIWKIGNPISINTVIKSSSISQVTKNDIMHEHK